MQDNGQDLTPLFKEVEQGWLDLEAAAQRIQAAADKLKETDKSIAGFQVEKALNKHKAYLIPAHRQNLQEYMKAQKIG